MLAFFSSSSNNTLRLVDKTGLKSVRIPIRSTDPVVMTEPFLLVCPTYARGDGSSSVPPQVIRFLNIPQNRDIMRGVIGCGNRNFGSLFCLGGVVVASKCQRPLLHKIELAGTPSDIDLIKRLVEQHVPAN